MFSKYIGIDLGTANVLVYVKGRGIVLNEPSVVAYSETDNRVVAVGSHARQMLGRTPRRIIVSRPMRDGVIADYLVTEAMLRYFIGKVVGKYSLFRPVVMVCIPAGVTNVEWRAVLDATIQAGAKEAHLIAEPLAAAIGANIPISSPRGNMIVDIGGGTCEAAVISLNDIVVSKSLRIGGNKIDEMIATYVAPQVQPDHRRPHRRGHQVGHRQRAAARARAGSRDSRPRHHRRPAQNAPDELQPR